MLSLLLAFTFSKISIIPRPISITETPGHSWTLSEGMQIGYDTAIEDFGEELAQFISDSIYTPTGIRLQVVKSPSVKLGIQLLNNPIDDQYYLNVDSNLVTIQGKNRELIFDGFQTLLQLLPSQIYSNKTVTSPVTWEAPCVTVQDKPRLQWRGIMLDVCRHFFDVDTVKSIIDGMAHFKLNVLHFHLTEDQGWRLELKNFPNLTKYGSIRDGSPKHHSPSELDGIPYGPFYFSEEEISDIIEYGRMRSVSIIPEIEMPGHALSLLSGYPQYSCTGGPFKPRCFWGVEQDIICAGNDEAIAFLERILDDVLDIFPSVFIHCGGDECPRTRWQKCERCQKRIKDEGLKNEDQLQCWFTQHFANYLERKGRRLIGWDEILSGDLPFPESTIVMSWRGVSGGQKAAKLGHDVVMSPNSALYLDYWQFAAPEPYEYLGGLTSSYKIYHYNPTDGLEEQYHKYIIGVQGNLWAEYVWERTDCQYKIFPRCLAVAETGWVENDSKDWYRFLCDYANKEKDVLENLGVVDAGMQYGTIGMWKRGELSADKWVSVEFPVDDCLNQKGVIEVAFISKGGHKCYVKNVKFLIDSAVEAEDGHEGVVDIDESENAVYTFNTSKKPSGKISVQAEMKCVAGDDCEGVLYVTCEVMQSHKNEEAPLRNYEF